MSGIVGLTGFTNFLDHRLYVSFFGIFLMIGQLKILDKISNQALIIITISILILFCCLNINHSKNFKDPISFYKSAVESTPKSYFIQRGLANVYHRLKLFDRAEKHYKVSLELNPNSIETLNNLAINFKMEGKLDSAEFYFLKALKLNPNFATTNNNLGNFYLQLNQLEKAEVFLHKAIANRKTYFEAFNNLGVLYARRGNDSLAYKNFLHSIEINPYFAEGYFNLALYFYNKNQIDSSKYYYLKAVKNGFPEKNILSERLKLSH
jgi:Flp pilus assembly protein TadD